MIKIYSKNEYLKEENIFVDKDYFDSIELFTKNEYIVKIYKNEKYIFAFKNGKEKELLVIGDDSLIEELVDNLISLGLNFKKCIMKKDLAKKFSNIYLSKMGGSFTESIKEEDILMEYKKSNITSCVLAGGCFWCMAKPYYEYDGIIHVYSGYSGGDEILPKYEEVKKQETHHKECVKLIYDESIISYKEILDIYFNTIDPFDDGGQFIDRGDSYTTALFYNDEKVKEEAVSYIEDIERRFEKKVAVKVLEEKVFYMAEEYHQDYAIKNPQEMQKELEESGRIKKKDS